MMSMKMDNMFSEEAEDEVQQRGRIHKEEGRNRRKLDAVDRTKIRNEIMGHTNPLQTQPDDPLHNIVNGRVAASEVNVDEALEIGKTTSADYLAKLPTEFYEPHKKNVLTMESLKKKVQIGDANVYDIEQRYARMLVISQNRDIRVTDLFKDELSSVPASLFDDFGDLRKGTKANMLHKISCIL